VAEYAACLTAALDDTTDPAHIPAREKRALIVTVNVSDRMTGDALPPSPARRMFFLSKPYSLRRAGECAVVLALVAVGERSERSKDAP